MADANLSDPDVLARLRLLLPGADGSGTDGSGADGSGADGSGTDGSGTDGSGTDRSGAVGRARMGPPAAFLADPVATRRIGPGAPWARPHASGEAEAEEFESAPNGPAPTGQRLSGLGAFDPGRRGVKALAGVAVVVVLVAASLAWRARPRVEPTPPGDAATVSGSASAVAPSDTSTDGGTRGGAPRAGADPAGGASSAAGTTEQVVVAVGGKVRKPGLVRLPPGARVADAVQAAGGAPPGVDIVLLNLARKVVDGELILVGVSPSPGLPAAAAAGTSPAGPAGSGGGPVNLNTATPAELDTLPGVGPVLAQRIVDHREKQGTFGAVSDLRKVDGIGDARYEQLKDLVTV